MKRFLIILLSLSASVCTAQFKKHLDSLCVVCKRSASDSEKVDALGKLANLYYSYQLNRQGDSVLHDQLVVAELSDNKNLMLATFFGDAITNISIGATTENFDNTLQFIEKGIDYAKANNLYDYIGIGYTRMADILTKRGLYDKALYNSTLALQVLPNILSDSVKAIVYIQVGNTYLSKGEAVSACTNYNNAFDIALKINSIPLQSNVYHCYSEMYRSLGDDDIAVAELKKSLVLDKENRYYDGLIRDYFELSKVTDEKFYLDRGIALSDSIGSHKYLLKGKNLLFYYYMIVEKNKDNKAIDFLETDADLKESFINVGMANYYRIKGQLYLYSNQVDSALSYFKLAENDFIKDFGERSSRGLFKEIGQCYSMLNNIPSAIEYYTKALSISKKLNDAKDMTPLCTVLSKLYEKTGNYEQAFLFSKQATEYKDSLSNLSKARDIALLGVERENRKHDEELRQSQNRENNKRNLQYTGISIAICIIFVGMLVLGMFPISKVTIKLFGYFFFISLFEFIVLVIDTFLHRITHGEPLKIWLIKIFLIALLVPLQHFLEHSLIRFLASRKLLEARTKFSLRKWWHKMQKPATVATVDTGFEKDTAVL